MHTDESQMTSGTVNFYVGGVQCPETNGVGVDAKGGVFNCGLSGRTFEARCEPECSDTMAVVEIKLWKHKIMSIYGTPYTFDGNKAHNSNYNSLDYVWGVGSYNANLKMTIGDNYRTGVGFAFDQRVYLTKIHFYRQDSWKDYGFQTGDSTFLATLDVTKKFCCL